MSINDFEFIEFSFSWPTQVDSSCILSVNTPFAKMVKHGCLLFDSLASNFQHQSFPSLDFFVNYLMIFDP